jgi:cell wall assembly regulator SMI1
MPISKRLSQSGATEESLIRLESEIGHLLPQEYRQFLKDLNGGAPDPSGFIFETKDGQSDSSVRYFLTLDQNEKNYSLKVFLSRYKNRIPEGVIPIGCDSFGNLILIDLGARAVGSVYFWDHEKESMGKSTWDNVSTVSSSFNEFNALLR